MDVETFLKEAQRYQLGGLPTEGSHPRTRELSELVRSRPLDAITLLHQVEIEALQAGAQQVSMIDRLAQDVRATLVAGHRVYIAGCGATGRLALTLEAIWRKSCGEHAWCDRVVSLMAGGDVAMVRAVEDFEDHPEYGARQLDELGFGPDDLLIACTEGGETPFVIGTAQHAAECARTPPWFVYCNPTEALSATVERSRRVIEDDRIRKLCLFVGPMALSGSTRLQACTIQQLAVGAALFAVLEEPFVSTRAGEIVMDFVSSAQRMDLRWIEPFLRREAEIYLTGGRVRFEVNESAISVFTDITERSPTFNLDPFPNRQDRDAPKSLATVVLTHATAANEGALASWTELLGRAPRTLEWSPEVSAKAGRSRLLGFDFSTVAMDRDREVFGVKLGPTVIAWDLAGDWAELPVSGDPLFFKHLKLKIALNIQSTLVMGLLGRYESNMMTWVKPTNRKLIDRSVRYAMLLLERRDVRTVSYETVTREVFTQIPLTDARRPVVLAVVDAIMERMQPRTGGAP